MPSAARASTTAKHQITAGEGILKRYGAHPGMPTCQLTTIPEPFLHGIPEYLRLSEEAKKFRSKN